jgi:hypothetical protein
MSGVGFYMTTGEVALSAATAKTVIEVTAAANHRAVIKKIHLWFKGVSVTDESVTVDLIRIATTGTGSAGTPVKRDPDMPETLAVDFKHTFTVEPTGVTVLETFSIHPQSGYAEVLPIEWPIPIPGGDLWGIRCTADNAVSVIANVLGEE